MPETRLRPGISGNSACSQSDHSPCREDELAVREIETGDGLGGVRMDA